MSTPRLFAVVLAAGNASRFGSTKQLAEYRGRPLVQLAVRRAERVCGADSILVVGADWRRVHEACAPLKGFLVMNDAHEAGMSSSIAAGVRAVATTADAILLLLADQPLVTSDDLTRLIDAWGGSATSIVCSSHAGVIGPPVIFPSRYFGELTAQSGDKGAREVLERHADEVVRVPCAAAAVDVDSPRDLDALRD